MTIALGIGVVVAIFVLWELAKWGLERGAFRLIERFTGRRDDPETPQPDPDSSIGGTSID